MEVKEFINDSIVQAAINFPCLHIWYAVSTHSVDRIIGYKCSRCQFRLTPAQSEDYHERIRRSVPK